MIAIPNIDKPKRCEDCLFFYLDGSFEEYEWGDDFKVIMNCEVTGNMVTDDRIADDCPLIEIVTCGECKYEYSCGQQIKRNGLTLKLTCCEYGERRADGDI